ncbi:MAG: sulfatase, partial [bacterium]|nr:sulfatase [bacterium]
MRKLVLLLIGGVLGLAAAESPPNFVLIVADDMGYGDLGCYGNASIRTPHIDGLAAEGMRFTEFYAASPLCSPSRAALMTGRLPIRTGVNRVLAPVAKRGLNRREVTIAEVLRPRGYATACIGKWHLGRLPRFLPTRQGFDSYFGLPYSNDMSRKSNPTHPLYKIWLVPIPPLPLMRNEKIIEREPDQSQLTRRYTDEATRFIRQSAGAGRPFFLYLPHTSPHPPLHASERFAGKSAQGSYGDVIEELDWSTGEVLRTLDELKLADRTLVIFASDHGPWLAKDQEGGSSGPLREGKGSTWEGGVRVPFIARWPDKIPAGVTTSAFGTTMDLLPTFA